MTCLTNDLLSFLQNPVIRNISPETSNQHAFPLWSQMHLNFKNEYFPEAIPWHSRRKPCASGSGHLGVSQFLFPLSQNVADLPCWCDSSSSLWGSSRQRFPQHHPTMERGTLFSLPTEAASRPDTSALQARRPLSILAPAPLPSWLDSQSPQDWKPRSPNTPACASPWEPGSPPL